MEARTLFMAPNSCWIRWSCRRSSPPCAHAQTIPCAIVTTGTHAQRQPCTLCSRHVQAASSHPHTLFPATRIAPSCANTHCSQPRTRSYHLHTPSQSHKWFPATQTVPNHTCDPRYLGIAADNRRERGGHTSTHTPRGREYRHTCPHLYKEEVLALVVAVHGQPLWAADGPHTLNHWPELHDADVGAGVRPSVCAHATPPHIHSGTGHRAFRTRPPPRPLSLPSNDSPTGGKPHHACAEGGGRGGAARTGRTALVLAR